MQEPLYKKKNLIEACEFHDYATLNKPVSELVGNARFIMFGESTHGTYEFYKIRAELTKHLIESKHINAVAIEGDWPDAYMVNRYVKGDQSISSALDSLEGFKRFPTWMWRNKVVLEFIEWLHDYNLNMPEDQKIGFYGLDLYSLNASIEVVISCLEKIDIEAAKRAKERYACFDLYREELQHYGYANMLGLTASCQEEVVEQLMDLHKNVYEYLQKNSLQKDEVFYLEQNARLIKNAEEYYRCMFSSRISSWNIRDTHMAETLEMLAKHLDETMLGSAKIVVWAHNSHVGDARYTALGKRHKELNVGQLMREKHGPLVVLLGFLTYAGTVTAATEWDGPVEKKYIRPALYSSYEYYFHQLEITDFFIKLRDNSIAKSFIPDNRLERAIGVIYRPITERISHYFTASLKSQFDGLIYIDKTTALEPLEKTAEWHKGEIFETFPTGL